MRGSKEHARPTEPVRQAEPAVSDGQPRASGSTIPRENAPQPLISGNSDTQPTVPDGQSTFSPGTTSETSSGVNHNILVDCNALVEGYRKGEVSKATAYFEIQSKLTKVFGDDRARTDAAFGSFIATIESYDSENAAAARRGRVFEQEKRSPSPSSSVSDGRQSDEQPVSKRIKIDESAYACIKNKQDKRTVL